MQSENVGQAADTSRSSCQPTESRWEKLASEMHAIRSGVGWGVRTLPSDASSGSFCVAEPSGATSPKWTPGNHDEVPPVQCCAKRENDSRPPPFLLEVKPSIALYRAISIFSNMINDMNTLIYIFLVGKSYISKYKQEQNVQRLLHFIQTHNPQRGKT